MVGQGLGGRGLGGLRGCRAWGGSEALGRGGWGAEGQGLGAEGAGG
jgi:hypothetical protein